MTKNNITKKIIFEVECLLILGFTALYYGLLFLVYMTYFMF